MNLISNQTISRMFFFIAMGLLFQIHHASAGISQQRGFPQPIGDGGFGLSSPVFGNLDFDSDLEIVIGSFDGKVYAFNPDGTEVFPPYNTGTAIDATPTLADIDDDGELEIIVTLGSGVKPTQRGGLIVLENDGTLKAKLDGTQAQNSRNGVPSLPPLLIPEDVLFGGPGDGIPDIIDSSVAIRDIDGNGSLDLVFGAHDANIYALRNDLTLIDSGTDDDGDGQINEDPGWERKNGGSMDDDGDIPLRCFGVLPYPCMDEDPIDWPVDNQDSVPSTAALGDVDGDGDIEVVIGGGSTAAPASTCQTGGTIWVLHHTGNANKAWFGRPLPGSNIYRLEPTGCTEATIISSPALVDIDNDNKLEIFVGTSSDIFRPGTNPNQVYGFRYNALTNTLENLPGWPVATTGYIQSSPAIGDIDNDGQVEIVVAGGHTDGKIYAFHTNGSLVSGFPVQPTKQGTGTLGSPVIADVNGDGKADIVVGNAFDLFAFDGSGNLLPGFGGRTAISAGAPIEPTILSGADGLVNSTPAIGDIDNDGKVEVAFASSEPVGKLYVIEAGAATGVLPWPMFHQNAAHTGVYELNSEPPVDVIKVTTSKTSYSKGDTMNFFWSINNSGAKGFTADIFLGAILPDNSLLFFTSLKGDNFILIPAAHVGNYGSFAPTATSYDISPNTTMSETAFFTYGPLPAGPGGKFTVFGAMVKPGTVQAGAPQIIGIIFASFTY